MALEGLNFILYPIYPFFKGIRYEEEGVVYETDIDMI